MHISRRGLHFALTASAVVGIALAGCGTDDGEPSGDPLDGTNLSDAPREREHVRDDTRPAFDASFDEKPDAGDRDEDPTPPGGDQCIDKDDPGGTESGAKALPDTDDCDNSYKTVMGIANGAVDVDFYSLAVRDKPGCALQTDFEMKTAGTELCVYVRCQKPKDDAFKSCEQGIASTSDIGMKGCCTAGPGRAVPKWNCGGLTDNDSANFMIRVKQPSGNLCLPYEFQYRF